MANVDERSRHELYLSIEDLIGAEKAETLMSMLPPVGWADVATKADLGLLRGDLVAMEERIELRVEATLHRELRAQMRTLFFALIGTMFTMTSLNLTALALLR